MLFKGDNERDGYCFVFTMWIPQTGRAGWDRLLPTPLTPYHAIMFIMPGNFLDE